MWIYLGLLAAFFLSFYNLCKKYSVQDNASLPVLLLTSFFAFLSISPLYLLSYIYPELLHSNGLIIPSIKLSDHFYIIIKSLILSASWLLSFVALKHLPITIVSPIRASAPFFTVIGALLIFGERPNIFQWFGFASIILSMILYSNIGKKEGIVFKNNKWIYAIIGATFLGACSGLYDKFLVQHQHYNAQTIQLWSTLYIVIIIGIFAILFWYPQRHKYNTFKWRWSIPLVGLFLTASDFFYFRALQHEEALIMLLSAIKRSQLIITVIIGGFIFKEKNKRKKLIPLVGIIIGIALILYSK